MRRCFRLAGSTRGSPTFHPWSAIARWWSCLPPPLARSVDADRPSFPRLERHFDFRRLMSMCSSRSMIDDPSSTCDQQTYGAHSFLRRLCLAVEASGKGQDSIHDERDRGEVEPVCRIDTPLDRHHLIRKAFFRYRQAAIPDVARNRHRRRSDALVQLPSRTSQRGASSRGRRVDGDVLVRTAHDRCTRHQCDNGKEQERAANQANLHATNAPALAGMRKMTKTSTLAPRRSRPPAMMMNVRMSDASRGEVYFYKRLISSVPRMTFGAPCFATASIARPI